jgi:CheY-like chemotaxis protein
VESAAAALRALRMAAVAAVPYDLVVIDRNMPGTDGLELAAAIRADAALAAPAMVVLTSRSERLTPGELAARGLAAGELKPVHPEKLRACLARILTDARGAPAGAPRPLPAAVEHEGAGSILVAEDNPINQKVTLFLLRNLGFAADLAANGAEVLAALRQRPYALVLMDVQMPVLDGLEATRRIRAAQAAGEPGFQRPLCVIAMTANALNSDREVCLAAGMDDFMAKPVRPESLRAMLAKHLGPELPQWGPDSRRLAVEAPAGLPG